MSASGQSQAAAARNLYAAETDTKRLQQRLDVTKYNNKKYAQDIRYQGEVLEFKRSEFDRQAEHSAKAINSIETNLFNQFGTLMNRMVQENMAAVLEEDEIRRSGRSARATAQVNADARGVSGASVDMIAGDISRQEGEALTVRGMNAAATQQQLLLEGQAVKARSDTSIYNLGIQTFAPTPSVQAPAPVAPYQPTQRVKGPSLATTLVSTAGQAVSQYAGLSAQGINPFAI
ncbi:hypothetical protein ABID12_003072 [Martelella mangrovi]|uniref:Uncharacterized protein n=1 Tax=Martelella mangrovi TaxID=1397477 RepID=A0ABV2IDZ0_9HYPH